MLNYSSGAQARGGEARALDQEQRNHEMGQQRYGLTHKK